MSTEIVPFAERFPAAASRGIEESTWNALSASVYPGARPDSILMVIDYCRAQGLDPIKKPVHIVPMRVKNAQTGDYGWRDVVMPGINLYRIQAARSGDMAGISEPEFGPLVSRELTDKNGKAVSFEFPEWCKVTVRKIVAGNIVEFTAKELWLENYATDGPNSGAPNAMWRKRPHGQLAKVAESQALRKGWPEVCSAPTAEEMAGKSLDPDALPGEYSVVPEEPEPEPAAVAPEPSAPAGDPGGPVVNQNQLRILCKRLESAGLEQSAAAAAFGVDSLEALRFSSLNDVLSWIDNGGANAA